MKRRRTSAASTPYRTPRRRISYSPVLPVYTRTGQAYTRSLAAALASTGETKYFDTSISTANITSTGAIASSLNLVAQGTADNERIGREMKIKGLFCRGEFVLNESAIASESVKIRMIIYLDKQANGAAATMANILDTTVITGATNAFRNLDNAKRFKILKDKRIQLSYKAHDGTNFAEYAVNFNYAWTPKKPLSVEFSGTTGQLSEIRSNNIGILFVSSTAQTSFAQFRGGARIHFHG